MAVLPFVNASGDPNTEYLSDGISDSIINSLSRLPNLKSQLAQLGLALQGEADRSAGGRARAERPGGVDGPDDTSWRRSDDQRRVGGRERQPPAVGRQYNRKLSDILVVQDEIAREIAEKLRREAGQRR